MTRFRIEGLAELRAALRGLPEALRGEATHVVEAAGNAAAVDARAAYGAHTRSGNLASHVTVDPLASAGRFAAGVVVKSTARHASLFETGTRARHTAIGAARGSMPAAHVFVPTLIRQRRRMEQALADLLRRNGLEVHGGDDGF